MVDDGETREADGGRRSERKERVLHTRVPEVLVEDLKQLAEGMKVPVSNLVRTALEEVVDAFSAVSRKTEGELRGLAARLVAAGHDEDAEPSAPAGRSSAARPPLEGIVGFQHMTLAREAVCALSGRSLAPGEDAYFGVRDGEGPLVIVAPECVPRGAGEAP
ncbi:MAG: ribbon-helix-helix domain-containing protein [Deltaproteobacteria bacterium]|nr:ribbon-helix-helix domain-containing protein [Deltaproteobacteria bacterium]MBW2359272.1 ribbon-helix-helix domain-containing protein [Deltaproteobacteria bacterium]